MESTNESLICLRALEVSDLDRVHMWHNDAELYQHLGGTYHWVSRSAEEEWLRRRCAYSPTEINLAICLTTSNEHIGNIYLRNIDWVARNAELHIFIGAQNQRSHGYGEAAIYRILSHSFGDLGLQRIYLFVLATNEPAIRLYKKAGLKEEGRLRNHAFKKGHLVDIILMGILYSEWKGPQE